MFFSGLELLLQISLFLENNRRNIQIRQGRATFSQVSVLPRIPPMPRAYFSKSGIQAEKNCMEKIKAEKREGTQWGKLVCFYKQVDFGVDSLTRQLAWAIPPEGTRIYLRILVSQKNLARSEYT